MRVVEPKVGKDHILITWDLGMGIHMLTSFPLLPKGNDHLGPRI